MSVALLIIGALALSCGLVLAFRPGGLATLLAYVGMWCMSQSGYAPISPNQLIFWAIATIIVCAIWMTRKNMVPLPRSCRNFIVGGTLAGMAVGLTSSQSSIILLSAIGAVVGGLAYSSTPKGRSLPRGPWRPIAAVGIPAVVTLSIIGTSVSVLIALHS